MCYCADVITLLQDFTTVAKVDELEPFQSKGSRESREGSKGRGGGWDEEVLAGDDGSDMEGWEDDGWGDFGDKKQQQRQQQTPSSGADFFDTFHGSAPSKPRERDYFLDFDPVATSSSQSAKREKSPPPVSADLFGSSTREKSPPSTGGAKKTGSSSDDWGDWGSDFGSTKLQVRHHSTTMSVYDCTLARVSCYRPQLHKLKA